MTEQILALAAFLFVSSITPGPNNLMLMASGANFGITRTLPHAGGVALGVIFMIIALGLGLMALFERFPVVHEALKYACAAYLCYLAWKIASAPTQLATSEKPQEPAREGKPFTFLQAVAFQWVNPKAWTMAMTALSVYAFPGQPLNGLLLIAVTFFAVNLPCISTWMSMGTQMRRLLKSPTRMRVFNVTASILLLGTLIPVFAQ